MKNRITAFTIPALSLALAGVLGAQTLINGSRTIAGTVNYCADAGSTDAYACNIEGLTAYGTGVEYSIKANTANTGAATVNLTSIGAVTIKKREGGITTDLATNDIRAGQIIHFTYDGTNMQCSDCNGNAPAGGGGSVTTVANATQWLPFNSYAYATNTPGLTANTVYLATALQNHWTEAQYSSLCAGIQAVAASGKYLAVGVYSKASNGDLTLLAATRFLVDNTVVAGNSGRCAVADHGSLVSGGLYTLSARGDLVFGMCSDGSPALVSTGSAIAQPLNEMNQGGTYLQKQVTTSSATPCTGTGASLAMPSSITAANQTAGSHVFPLLWIKR